MARIDDKRGICGIIIVMDTKSCTACKATKPLSAFGKCARAKDGLQWECKACRNARTRAYHADNAETLRANHRQWLKDNAEHVRDYSRRYNRGEKGSGRGAYDHISQLGVRREDFDSDADFARELNKLQSAALAARNKFFVDELKKAPCTDCGRTFDPVCMDFDHARGTKELEIGRMRYKNYSIEAIQREIDKCDLVCACCHRLRTKRRAEERRLTPHG